MLDTVKINHVQHISFTQSRLTDAVSIILSELLSYEHPLKALGEKLWYSDDGSTNRSRDFMPVTSFGLGCPLPCAAYAYTVHYSMPLLACASTAVAMNCLKIAMHSSRVLSPCPCIYNKAPIRIRHCIPGALQHTIYYNIIFLIHNY